MKRGRLNLPTPPPVKRLRPWRPYSHHHPERLILIMLLVLIIFIILIIH